MGLCTVGLSLHFSLLCKVVTVAAFSSVQELIKICKYSYISKLLVIENGGRRPGESYHMIYGTDVTYCFAF